MEESMDPQVGPKTSRAKIAVMSAEVVDSNPYRYETKRRDKGLFNPFSENLPLHTTLFSIAWRKLKLVTFLTSNAYM
jgi:hypothetical protein